MKLFLCSLVTFIAIFAHAATPRPKQVPHILAEDAIPVVVSSCQPDQTEALRKAITNWFNLAPYATEPARDKYRAELLTLLYSQDTPVAIAFADAFVPTVTGSAQRPHSETPAELMLSIVFEMPKSAKWNEVQDASRDDQRDTLPGLAADKTYRLRKLLGLPEIPKSDIYNSFPRDQETTIPWILSLARQAEMQQAELDELQAVFSVLQRSSGDTTLDSLPSNESSIRLLTVPPEPGENPTKSAVPSPGEEPPSSSPPWSLITVMIVAVLGLVWMLLKRRS